MKSILFFIALAVSGASQASTERALGADSVEMVNFLSHCLPEYKDALEKGDYVSKVTYSSPRPVKPGTRLQQSYALTVVNASAPEKRVAILFATRITDSSGAEAKVDYLCRVYRD